MLVISSLLLFISVFHPTSEQGGESGTEESTTSPQGNERDSSSAAPIAPLNPVCDDKQRKDYHLVSFLVYANTICHSKFSHNFLKT